MKHALYIVGEPGAGKSTLVETLVGDVPFITGKRPLAHLTYLGPRGDVTELGVRRPGGFSGTDGLSMSAVVPAEGFVTARDLWGPEARLLAEGDRLACDRFLNALCDGGWSLLVAHLDTPPGIASMRRRRRGSDQSEKWVRGRQTKVANIVERWADHVVHLDGREAPDALAYQLAALSPVAAALYPEEG